MSSADTVGGKDPVATFSTQVTRSPVVMRVGEHGQGVYELDPHGAYERARARLQEVFANECSEIGDGTSLEAARRDLDGVLEARTLLFLGRISRKTEAVVGK